MSDTKKSKKETNPYIYQQIAKAFCEDVMSDKKENIYKAVYWQETTYLYDSTKYTPLTEKELCHRLRQWLDIKKRPINNFFIGNVIPIIQSLIYQDRIKYPAMPFYYGTDTDDDFPKVENVIAYKNKLLNITAYLENKPNALMPHTPLWVSPVCLPYEYNPNATCPLWIRFLDEIFEGDNEKALLLQEWFGYCLTHDTSSQKFLIMCGVERAGKGVICDILKSMIGIEATAGFSLYQFARQFGLVPLVDKLVAFCGEVELKNCRDKNHILEVLKGITGEDELCIERKYQNALHLVLPTRLIICCNEMPTLYETTGALSSRLLLLQFQKSFSGKEDYELKDKLHNELSGISNWALEGLRRLRRNGRFSEPTAMKIGLQEHRRESNPTLAFIQDCLVVENRLNAGNLVMVELGDMPLSITKRGVEGLYRQWCLANDIQVDETEWQWFWRRMKVVLPKLEGKGRGDERVYQGIGKKEVKDTIGGL